MSDLLELTEDLLSFSRDVVDTMNLAPSWKANLVNFQRVLNVCKDENKLYKVESFFTSFIDTHLEDLEREVITEDKANDEWLNDVDNQVHIECLQKKPTVNTSSYSVPLTELYRSCVHFGKKQVNVGKVSHECLCLYLMVLLYKIIVLVRPDNEKFKTNLSFLQEIIEDIPPAADDDKLDFSSMLGSLMNPDKMKESASQMLDSSPFSSDTKENVGKTIDGVLGGLKDGNFDLGNIMSSFQPIMQDPSVQAMMGTLMSGMAGLSRPEPAEKLSITEEGDPNDQE